MSRKCIERGIFVLMICIMHESWKHCRLIGTARLSAKLQSASAIIIKFLFSITLSKTPTVREEPNERRNTMNMLMYGTTKLRKLY